MERKKLTFRAVSGTWIDETIDKKQINEDKSFRHS